MTRRGIAVPLALALVAAVPAGCDRTPARSPVTLDELSKRGIVGALGVPPGRIVRLESTVLSGDALKTKGDSGRYFVVVDKIEGKPVPTPVRISFGYAPGRAGPLQPGRFARDTFLHATKTGTLTAEMMRELDRNDVGRRFRASGDESDRFPGIPEGLPPAILRQDRGYGFENGLILTDSAESDR